MPIKPKPNESESDFMSRCIATERDAGKPQDQAVAICLTAWAKKEISEGLVDIGEALNDIRKGIGNG
jgi:hypothetical protein